MAKRYKHRIRASSLAVIMIPQSDFEPERVLELIQLGMLITPLAIRAELGTTCVEALLLSDGGVKLEDACYSDLQQAMDNIPHHRASTSDAWQFWSCYSDTRQAWTPLEHHRAKLEGQYLANSIRTSETDPLRIDRVRACNWVGHVGLTFCPGKKCEGIYGGIWQRDLHQDLATIEAWGAVVLISLVEEYEFSLLQVPEFASAVEERQFDWIHLPIQDMRIPDQQFEEKWLSVGPQLHQQIVAGYSIVIHCRGGLGRTGLVAARMLVEAGLDPAVAIATVRNARKHSIETYAQENYILTEQWKHEYGKH